jgi:GH35 family endo-1,4-beta-xylanase
VTAAWISGESDDSAQYRKFIKQGFNTIVFGNDFKWPNMEIQSWDETMKAVKWFQENSIAIRGHNLVWGSYRYLPGDIQNATKDQAVARIENRIKSAAQQTKGLVYIWDVVNEAVTETELWDKVGWDQFPRTFKLAREAMPGVQLAYNDFNISNENPSGTRHREQAIERAKLIQAAGPYLDVFGDQAHMSSPPTPISTVFNAWDEVHKALKVPMEITELDLSSWDDKGHGDYIRDYVTAAFSHPAMQAVIFWGIWERDHWLADQGGHMVNADWTPRPAWTEYLKLVNQTWRTSATLKTNAQGAASFRGFYGSYRVTATVNGKKVSGSYTLTPGGAPARVTLR